METIGRRRSASITNTFRPAATIARARFALVCDLPSLETDDVTTSTGYKLFSGNVVPIRVPSGGYKLGAITAGASGTLRYHRVH